MSNIDKIINYLGNNKKKICDDCISDLLDIKPRQQVNKICNTLTKKDIIKRYKCMCENCNTIKITNYYTSKEIKNTNKLYKAPKLDNSKLTLGKSDLECISELNEVNIEFLEIDLENIFLKYNKYTVKGILNTPKYNRYYDYVSKKYFNYLNYNINEFLFILKKSEDFDYKLFLNPYGDLKFCRFKITALDLDKKKGIYIYKIDNEIVYIGRCLDNFEKRINTGYANISPKNCFLDGQSTNCRINNLINNNRNKIKLYILELNDVNNIKRVEKYLINKYKPLWNIQGK